MKTNKKHFPSARGITLIALVITIIVLLILAGISISMLSGDNSILQKATDAKQTSERAEIVENAKMDILAKISEKKGENITEDELEEILTSSNYNTQGTLSNEENILDKTLTSKNGKYIIPVSEIYNGKLARGKIKNSVADLREGDEVVYTDGNGNTIPCIVLYDSTGSYGIQIISKDTVGSDITLGHDSDFNEVKLSYNTEKATLNNAAIAYLNTNLATNARCVGSSPSETPITSEDNTGTFTCTYNYFLSPTNFNNQLKTGDNTDYLWYEGDFAQMKKSNINCYSISKEYWLAVRNVVSNEMEAWFRMLLC